VLTAHAHELTRLREEHEQATAEVERLQTTLAQAETTHEQQLSQLEEKHEQATAELDRLRTDLPDTQAAALAEQERLRTQLAKLESVVAETETAHEQELMQLQGEHEQATAEVERMQTTLAEAETAAAEQERRLAEEHERHAGERDELIAQGERLQEELGAARERLAGLDPAAEEERDQLRAEVERLRAASAETERVRESQIALAAERDRAVAELERLEAIAAEAQAAVQEQTRLLADEQDRHDGERESLVAERKVVEEKLDDALERLAAAANLADERGRQLQRAAERLHDAFEDEPGVAAPGTRKLAGVGRRLAAKLASADEAETEAEQLETEAETEAAAVEETEAVVSDLKNGAVAADNPPESTNWRPLMDEYFESETMFDEPFVEPGDKGGVETAEPARTWDLIDDQALGAPVWGRSLERVLGLFDSEATRLQELRGKMQGLGREMAAREARVKELEAELQRSHIERLRDQETVDRLKHELAERNNRLERALANTQELAAIIQGAQIR